MQTTIRLLTWIPRKVVWLLYFFLLAFVSNYYLDQWRRAIKPTDDEFLKAFGKMWRGIWIKLNKSGL